MSTKKPSDYSNTIIYKIYCKDPVVTELYVGHTIDFVKRQNAHMYSSRTPSCKCKLYECIRQHGGWENWHMSIIGFFNCANEEEARKFEQEHLISLKATLNSNEPYPTKFKCQECNFSTTKHIKYENHLSHAKHKKLNEQHADVKCSKFCCEYCDYKTIRNSEYVRHLATRKHIDNASGNKKNRIIQCKKCNKIYKTRKGLWLHAKKCVCNDDSSLPANPVNNDSQNISQLTALLTQTLDGLMSVVKSNTEIQKQMLQICKNANM